MLSRPGCSGGGLLVQSRDVVRYGRHIGCRETVQHEREFGLDIAEAVSGRHAADLKQQVRIVLPHERRRRYGIVTFAVFAVALLTGIAVETPAWIKASTSRKGFEDTTPEDTFDGDYGRLLERAYEKSVMSNPRHR